MRLQIPDGWCEDTSRRETRRDKPWANTTASTVEFKSFAEAVANVKTRARACVLSNIEMYEVPDNGRMVAYCMFNLEGCVYLSFTVPVRQLSPSELLLCR